ncbi:hypothetical protein HHO41_04865 [Bacillus sp. DNRA2]|uniref:phBC6A51 family helix-turn-helix protein n=1 Tax=Bacillus sp. DNRA2 TaxID=2723053 RepID=UPI00145CCEB6|nr:phBC6A51 family helix-turn-helix protein [Bacillus sp. DNRA2]NMD69612.1 hypothetical protein [Bacillus sp. DNRA2]
MLKKEQLEAIKYLAQPKNGGLTQDQIAEAVGVTRMTLHRWKQDIEFQDELKREIGRNTMNRIPDVLEAMFKSATQHGSANAAKLILQSVGMLTDKLEVEDRTKHSEQPKHDVETMQAEIERIRALRRAK